MVQAWFAAASISNSAAFSTCGKPCPPASDAQASAGQPAATKAR